MIETTGGDATQPQRPAPAPRRVRVAEMYPNPEDPLSLPPVQAFAKLSGYDWTYYIKTTRVIVGRSPEVIDPDEEDPVDVDLGPTKTVSRRHCAIVYNYDTSGWEVEVLGRNGIKVDGETCRQGQGNAPLTTGKMLEIGGIQFLFLLPNVDDPQEETETAEPSSVRGSRGRGRPATKRKARAGAAASTAADSETAGLDGDADTRPAAKRAKTAAAKAKRGKGASSAASDTRGGGDTDLNMALSGPTPPDWFNGPYPTARDLGVHLIRDPTVDWTSEESSDRKPPYSYASLIAEAISAQPMGCASLQDIYEYIADRYAFYKNATHAWQNSVRHNLALNKCFLKIGKVGGQGNKGFVWRLDPERANEISDESRRGRKVNDSSSKNDHTNARGGGRGDNGRLTPATSAATGASTPAAAAAASASAATQGMFPGAMDFSTFQAMFGGMPMLPGMMPPGLMPRLPGFGGPDAFGMMGSSGLPGFNPAMAAAAAASAGGSGGGAFTGSSLMPGSGYGVDMGELPVHARPFRSFYSLYHTTPDLTLLPSALDLMRSMPKSYKRFSLMDQDPAADDMLVGDFLDRDAFPPVGAAIALTKEQLTTKLQSDREKQKTATSAAISAASNHLASTAATSNAPASDQSAATTTIDRTSTTTTAAAATTTTVVAAPMRLHVHSTSTGHAGKACGIITVNNQFEHGILLAKAATDAAAVAATKCVAATPGAANYDEVAAQVRSVVDKMAVAAGLAPATRAHTASVSSTLAHPAGRGQADVPMAGGSNIALRMRTSAVGQQEQQQQARDPPSSEEWRRLVDEAMSNAAAPTTDASPTSPAIEWGLVGGGNDRSDEIWGDEDQLEEEERQRQQSLHPPRTAPPLQADPDAMQVDDKAAADDGKMDVDPPASASARTSFPSSANNKTAAPFGFPSTSSPARAASGHGLFGMAMPPPPLPPSFPNVHPIGGGGFPGAGFPFHLGGPTQAPLMPPPPLPPSSSSVAGGHSGPPPPMGMPFTAMPFGMSAFPFGPGGGPSGGSGIGVPPPAGMPPMHLPGVGGAMGMPPAAAAAAAAMSMNGGPGGVQSYGLAAYYYSRVMSAMSGPSAAPSLSSMMPMPDMSANLHPNGGVDATRRGGGFGGRGGQAGGAGGAGGRGKKK